MSKLQEIPFGDVKGNLFLLWNFKNFFPFMEDLDRALTGHRLLNTIDSHLHYAISVLIVNK